MTARDLDPGVAVLSETALRDRISRPKPVLVLYYADWCPFCAAFMPDWRREAADLPMEAAGANLSHPEDPRWDDYGVESVPTLIAYEAGSETARLDAVAGVGISKAALKGFLETLAPPA